VPDCDQAEQFAALLLFDDVCGLCNRVVRFALRHDKRARLRFAALDSDFARAALKRCGLDPAHHDSVVLVEARGGAGILPADNAGSQDACPANRPYTGARAVLRLLRLLGGGWAALAALLGVLPVPLLDWTYRWIARRRYRFFGRQEACPVLPPQWRRRFIS
jgi:predicted DCC family thiol-disulfide oxidoreductase YuxK